MSDEVVLAFDYGLARIGVAVGTPLTSQARPLRILFWKTNEQKWQQIQDVIAEWAPGSLVVGIPWHPDGNPNTMTATCQKFANQLRGRFKLPVHCVDERFTSVEAQGSPHALGYIDDEAAAVILQQWFYQEQQA